MPTAAIAAGDPRPPLAGVELGGTKCVCILARGPDAILDRVTIPTRGPGETLSAIGAVLDSWRFAALGIASFGPLDLGSGIIGGTPKAGWSGVDLTTLRRGTPTVIDTDVNGPALAEGRWGAAQGLASWTYITVGTGVGVGSIIAGQPVRGLGHSEAGHLRVPNPGGWPGICPFHGDCVEGLASGPAIAARAGKPGNDLTPDDPIWPIVADVLATLCHNLVFTAVPERILIGGGVAAGQPFLLPMVRLRLLASLGNFATGAAIARYPDLYLAPPGLGTDAGPLGAIALAASTLDPIGQA